MWTNLLSAGHTAPLEEATTVIGIAAAAVFTAHISVRRPGLALGHHSSFEEKSPSTFSTHTGGAVAFCNDRRREATFINKQQPAGMMENRFETFRDAGGFQFEKPECKNRNKKEMQNKQPFSRY